MKKLGLLLATITIIVIVAGTILYAMNYSIDVLQPQGLISGHQRDLFYLAIFLGLVCLIPVFIMTFIIIQRYHDGNGKANKRFNRDWDIKPEASIIWGVFIAIVITVLAVIMYKSTFAYDPYKPITGHGESKVVQVIALPWKWLFIYPEENIASVNELAIPVGQPITFELTADAPMSSFWIPKLGGMIYTMEGMVTHLNLMAKSEGEFEGKNTEINGLGYSGMNFKALALSEQDYAAWVEKVQSSEQELGLESYEALAKQSIDHPVEYFATADQTLYGKILAKFMNHESSSHGHSDDYQESSQEEHHHEHSNQSASESANQLPNHSHTH